MDISARVSRLAAVAALIVAAACGGSKSPVSPSETGQPGASAGTAVVTGSVRGGAISSLAADSAGHAITGITVSIVGTSLASTVDAAGGFSLVGVPPGDMQLRFSGAGIDATISLSQVRASETITIVVSVINTTATVESQKRATGSGVEIEGRIESLPPTMGAGSLKVAGQTVTTDGSTKILQGSVTRGFSFLEIGMRVHVKGQSSGSEVLASIIDVQNTNTGLPVIVNGTIDSFSGTAAAFQFRVGSRLVMGDQQTEFYGESVFSELEDGARVEVKGLQRDGYVYATRIHVNTDDDDDDDDGDQDESASIKGKLTAKSGTAPALTLTVDGTTVTTTSGTEVKRRGDFQTLAALQIGQTVHVVGDRQADSSIVARKIEIEDDAPGGEFEIEGSVGGLKGTCPSLTFGVNSFIIITSAATSFDYVSIVPSDVCAAIKNGSSVVVKGTRNADGTVAAKQVKVKK